MARVTTILGTILRDIRMEKGLTQESIASLFGIPQPVVCMIENGRTPTEGLSSVISSLCNMKEEKLLLLELIERAGAIDNMPVEIYYDPRDKEIYAKYKNVVYKLINESDILRMLVAVRKDKEWKYSEKEKEAVG